MKFGHLIEYNIRKYFFKSDGNNEEGKVAPDLFLFFKKASQPKERDQHLSCNAHFRPQL